MGKLNQTDFEQATYKTGIYANPIASIAGLVAEYGHRHPIMVAEGGVENFSRSNRLDETAFALRQLPLMYKMMPVIFPQIKAMFYFNVDMLDEPYRYAMTNSPDVLRLYRELTSSPNFIRLGQGIPDFYYAKIGGMPVTVPSDNVTLVTYAPYLMLDDLRLTYRLGNEVIGTGSSTADSRTLNLSGRPNGRYAFSVTATSGTQTLGAVNYTLIKTDRLVTIMPVQTGRTVGARLGNVLNTDIKVFIDDVQILGYNVNDNTYVIVEQLRPYGFSVNWDQASFALGIRRGIAEGAPVPIPQNTAPTGSVAFPYVYTDVVAYVNGKFVSSFNIDGNTVISIDDLAREFGRAVWNGAARELRVYLD
jgi:hypothetical protein